MINFGFVNDPYSKSLRISDAIKVLNISICAVTQHTYIGGHYTFRNAALKGL